MRTTGPRWPAVLGLLVLVVVVAVGLLAFRRDPPDPASRRPTSSPTVSVGVHPGHWTAVPTPPLSARWGSVGGWTGRLALVVGGSTGVPCFVDCGDRGWRRDGAAYDPVSATWTRLPAAPDPVGPGSLAATTGATLVVGTVAHRWLALDTAALRWRTLPAPGFPVADLAGSPDAVYAVDGPGRRVAELDPVTGRWSRLPRPPRAASSEPSVTAYAGGLAITDAGRAVTRWDGRRWTRTPESAAGWIDPRTGTWQRLPPSPGPAGTAWLGLPQTDGRPATSGSGHVWVPAERTWVALGSPTARLTDATVVYAAPRIYVVGGLRVDRSGTDVTALVRHAWVWSP